MCENRLPWVTLGPRGCETGSWRKLYNEKLHR